MRTIFLLLCVVFLSEPSLSQRVEYTLDMRMDGKHQLYTGDSTNIWGFSNIGGFSPDQNLKLPAPTLTATIGDSVIVTVVNVSGEGHTIHWHGLDVDQENDGVPHTSDFVLTGDTFIYRFKATHAGNFIYHCHVTTTLHLTMGMYGTFIVYSNNADEIYPGGPQFDRQYDFLGSELDRSWNDDFMTGGSLNAFSATHFLLNGLEKQQLYEEPKTRIELNKNERVLLRLINIGFDVNEYHFPESINATVYTSDGRPLPQSFVADYLQLFPGERYSVIIETGEDDFEGDIAVNYLNLNGLRHQGTNHIGVNNDVYPVGVAKSKANESHAQLRVYPNPATTQLHLEGLPSQINEVLITSMSGQSTQKRVSQNSVVDISQLPPGVYFVSARSPAFFGARFVKR